MNSHYRRFRAVISFALLIMILTLGYSRLSWSEEYKTLKFEGKAKRGQAYSHPLNENLKFVLDPSSHGWNIAIHSNKHPDKNLAYLTPPYHGPNPLYIDGWHFRNSDNTGPNESGPKNLNVPQEMRDFIFSSIAATVPFPTRYEVVEEYEKTFSQGTLTIKNYKLGNLFPNEQAFFRWMEFSVEIKLKE